MHVDPSIPSFTKLLWLGARNRGECAKLALRSWMAYVNQEDIRLAAGINQNMLRHVTPGQRAEVVFKLYSGRTFEATVESVAFMTRQGQLQPSGIVPLAPTGRRCPTA